MAKAWLDSQLLAQLLFPQSEESRQEVWALCAAQDWPWELPAWQCLLLENGIRRECASADDATRQTAQAALALWVRWLDEEIVVPVASGGPEAAALALEWSRLAEYQTPTTNRLLEAALAKTTECEAFASLDPQARGYAKRGGLRLLPAKL